MSYQAAWQELGMLADDGTLAPTSLGLRMRTRFRDIGAIQLMLLESLCASQRSNSSSATTAAFQTGTSQSELKETLQSFCHRFGVHMTLCGVNTHTAHEMGAQQTFDLGACHRIHHTCTRHTAFYSDEFKSACPSQISAHLLASQLVTLLIACTLHPSAGRCQACLR